MSESHQPKFDRPLIITLAVLGLLAAFGGGIAFDRLTHRTAATTSGPQTATTAGRRGFASQYPAGARPIFGTVTSISGDTLTVTSQRDTSTMKVHISTSTVVTNNGTAAKATDITAGLTVVVSGTTTNGVVEATRIMLNPSFQGRGPNGSAPSTANPSNSY